MKMRYNIGMKNLRNILFLITTCFAGALPAEKVDVLVIPGGTAAKTADKTAKAFAKYFGEVADSLSLTTNAVEEAKLPDDLRAAADAVALGYNATVTPATLKKLRAFVKDGGRLLVACRLPKGVDEIMGLKQTGKITQRDALDPELAGILPVAGKLPPAAKYATFTRWVEYSAPVVELTGPGEVVAHWAKEGGAKRAEPAVVKTPAGVFISYLWFRGGSPAQRDLLEGVFRALLPGKAIVRKPDPAWRTDKPAPVPPKEHRGVWSHARGLFASGKNWDETCALLKGRGATDLYMLSAWAGAAFYESDVIPRAPHVAKFGDLVKQATDGAHKHGIRMHAWIVCWRLDQYADKALVERERAAGLLQVERNGTQQDWYCPSAPENRKKMADIACEIATRGVDGIHLDFIRFRDTRYCYCPRCRRLFEERLGKKVEKWPEDARWDGPLWEEWLAFRADQVSKTVEEASRRVRATNPKIILSAAVIRNTLFHKKHTERYKGTGRLRYRAWAMMGQDSSLWLERNWVDYVCPMDYDCEGWKDMNELAALQNSVAPGRVYPGIGVAAWTYPGGDAAKLAEMQDAVRAAGCAGSTIYVLDDDRAEFIEKWW